MAEQLSRRRQVGTTDAVLVSETARWRKCGYILQPPSHSKFELYSSIQTQLCLNSADYLIMRTYFFRAPGLLVAGILAALVSVSQLAVAQDATEKSREQSAGNAVEAVKKKLVPVADPAELQAAGAPAASAEEVIKRLNEQLPGIAFTEVLESTIPGLFEVITDGQIYYVDETVQFLVDGNLIRLSDRANLTDARLGRIHMTMIQDMDEKDMLIYEAENESDRSITVFTDISCGFCRRLHAEIDTLLEEGVRVRYLLFPRAGLGSQGHKDLESVWCADNPQEAMTIAKAGGQIDPKTCDNPIEAHVALAERLGLRGTPLIYTDGGEKVPGYREASTLVTMVNGSEPMLP